MNRFLYSFWFCGLFAAVSVNACTTFVMRGGGHIYFGRNLDWGWENGLVIINSRHVAKTSFVTGTNTPAKWTSKYGSVTFNQLGQEMPFGGMNEAGLVVENMWLDGTEYPAPDARPAINLLQWIQYQLDNCSTVADVVATDDKLRIEPPIVPAWIHYLICDANGDSATIEFLNGKLVCHRGEKLLYQVLANDSYEDSLAYARAHPETNAVTGRLVDISSETRFTRAATRVAQFKSGTSEQNEAYAFDTLDQVCQGDFTVWRMVYDVTARQIHFRTLTNPKERVIDLKTLDFSCAKPVQFVDIEANPDEKGRLPFRDLTEARHRKYLDSFLALQILKHTMGSLATLLDSQLLAIRNFKCQDN